MKDSNLSPTVDRKRWRSKYVSLANMKFCHGAGNNSIMIYQAMLTEIRP